METSVLEDKANVPDDKMPGESNQFLSKIKKHLKTGYGESFSN